MREELDAFIGAAWGAVFQRKAPSLGRNQSPVGANHHALDLTIPCSLLTGQARSTSPPCMGVM